MNKKIELKVGYSAGLKVQRPVREDLPPSKPYKDPIVILGPFIPLAGAVGIGLSLSGAYSVAVGHYLSGCIMLGVAAVIAGCIFHDMNQI